MRTTIPIYPLRNCTFATTQIATFHAKNAHTAPSQRLATNTAPILTSFSDVSTTWAL